MATSCVVLSIDVTVCQERESEIRNVILNTAGHHADVRVYEGSGQVVVEGGYASAEELREQLMHSLGLRVIINGAMHPPPPLKYGFSSSDEEEEEKKEDDEKEDDDDDDEKDEEDDDDDKKDEEKKTYYNNTLVRMASHSLRPRYYDDEDDEDDDEEEDDDDDEEDEEKKKTDDNGTSFFRMALYARGLRAIREQSGGDLPFAEPCTAFFNHFDYLP